MDFETINAIVEARRGSEKLSIAIRNAEKEFTNEMERQKAEDVREYLRELEDKEGNQ